MSRYPDFGHCVTALVDAPAAKAFEFLADPLSLGTWSLGCMNTQAAKVAGAYVGTSLYDDSQTSFAIEAHPERLLIDYLVGEPGRPKSRNSVRIIAGETCGLPDTQCYVSLLAWRPAHMPDDRWARLCAAHDAEIWLIKARIEGPIDGRAASRQPP